MLTQATTDDDDAVFYRSLVIELKTLRVVRVYWKMLGAGNEVLCIKLPNQWIAVVDDWGSDTWSGFFHDARGRRIDDEIGISTTVSSCERDARAAAQGLYEGITKSLADTQRVLAPRASQRRWADSRITVGTTSPRIVRVILKDEDEQGGQSVGPVSFETASGERLTRPDLARPDQWYTERQAAKIASLLGVVLKVQ